MLRSSHPSIHTPEMLGGRETQEELHLLQAPRGCLEISTFSQSFGPNPGAPEAALSLQQKWMET